MSEQQQQLSAAASAVAAAAAPPPPSNPALEAWFSPSLLPPRAASSLLNPGFADPFDPVADITLDNPKYRLCGVLPLMAGKLDWLLLRGPLAVASTHIGNHSYEHSDHKWIAANVTLGKS